MYLTFLITCTSRPAFLDFSESDWLVTRLAATINLKNSLKLRYKTQPAAANYVRGRILSGLSDDNRQIRTNVGSVITEFLRIGGVSSWPTLYGELLDIASDQSPTANARAQEGAMQALTIICEDHSAKLVRDYSGSKPVDVIVPRLLDLLNSSDTTLRSSALACLNPFILEEPTILTPRMVELVARLFALAEDQSSIVRRQVCKGFVALIEVRPDLILAHMDGLVDYILAQQKNEDDEDLALEAADFWLSIADHEQLSAALDPYLGKIIPVLLDCMVYSEEDIMMNEIDADEGTEDKDEDIAPRFAKTKQSKSAPIVTNGDLPNEPVSGQEDGLSEGEIEESDKEEGDPGGSWNLRKCSASSLDSLALVFHDRIFGFMLDHLQKNLIATEWPQRESAVLALGAVSPGCKDAIVPHLPQLVPYLIDLLNDPQPVVVQITCWTLGRNANWICSRQDAQERARVFEPMLERLLGRMLDKNKKTQEAAASAFALMLEQESSNLTNSVGPIVEQFIQCFGGYKHGNMPLLYDCIATLSPWLAQSPNRVDLTARLMKVIFERWDSLAEDSRELFALLECLGIVAVNLCEEFAPYAQHTYTKLIAIIAQNLEVKIAAADNPDVDIPDKDFLISCIDMISYLLQALGTSMSPHLLGTTQPHLREILPYCLQDPELLVRQSAFALLGDMAIFVFAEIERSFDQLMSIILAQLQSLPTSHRHNAEVSRVLNNICWSTGEILVRQPEHIGRYSESLHQLLLYIMLGKGNLQTAQDNAAIAMGRLGLAIPETLAKYLVNTTPAFLQITVKLLPSDEKDTAYQGYCAALMIKPESIGDQLPSLLNLIGIWSSDLTLLSPQLYEIFNQVRLLSHRFAPTHS